MHQETSLRPRPLPLFLEAKGSGKSKVRPPLHGKLLVVTPAAKDVRDIAWTFHDALPLHNSAP